MNPIFRYKGPSAARGLIEEAALKLDAELVVVDAYKRQGEPAIWLVFIHDSIGRMHIRSTIDYSVLPLLMQQRQLVAIMEAWKPSDPLPKPLTFDDE